MLIDFHTHHEHQAHNLINVLTLHVTPALTADDLPDICSLGLHPWFVQGDTWQDAWQNLVTLASSSQVITIGECGLDRHIDLPLATQIEIFKKHIQLAENLQKPLVIHCVRAFAELIALKKNTKSTIPWIIHGFHKKQAVFEQLLRHDFYFSFGAAILCDRNPVVTAIAMLPDGKFLLETDDRTDISIEQIYDRAAQLRHLDVEALQTQLVKTYHQLTGRF
ncbi:TatD family hydrolase [Pseudanabaena mucicola]|uniref:TatD family hydrolase n=1 Tax=Pseudanabaena mucicola FACHB-723 TaxID=2692860 RepID=A0ABR7ZVR9_9CYAN|nr:TatD family hydrolase [Pseudanabaena mucicola]MBD2187849.1 TatD family hydrolase [Pseudanabaena mucicola FACHB-723]